MLLWLPVDLASSGHRTNRMKRLFARLFLLRFKLLLAGGASFFFAMVMCLFGGSFTHYFSGAYIIWGFWLLVERPLYIGID